MGLAKLRELRLLEDALKRMARGEYGICKRCGRGNSEARRRAVLYAVLGHRRSRCGERRNDGDERSGLEILRRALAAPTLQIAKNAAGGGGVAVAELLKSSGHHGDDAAWGVYADLV